MGVMPKISIIIPIYNVEHVVSRCIDSVLTQSYCDFECILVNDGSTDKSGIICDEYARKDSRIKVFHKINGGVGSARNYGLNSALGEWIVFVDGDDELLPNSLEYFIKGTKKGDLVVAGYVTIKSNGFKKENNLLNISFSKQEALSMFLWQSSIGYQGYLWNKIFKRKIIEQYSIRFNESFAFNEDRLFCVQYVSRLTSPICLIDKKVYLYHLNDSSTIGSLLTGFNKKIFTDFYAQLEIHKIILSHGNAENRYNSQYTLYKSYQWICKMIKQFKAVEFKTEKKYIYQLLLEYVPMNKIILFSLPRKIHNFYRKNFLGYA